LPRLVTTARVPRRRLDELQAARDGLVVEEAAGDGSFVAVDGPVAHPETAHRELEDLNPEDAAPLPST
jgi:hypothetical protein